MFKVKQLVQHELYGKGEVVFCNDVHVVVLFTSGMHGKFRADQSGLEVIPVEVKKTPRIPIGALVICGNTKCRRPHYAVYGNGRFCNFQCRQEYAAGITKTEAVRVRMSVSHLGKTQPHSEETKRKIREGVLRQIAMKKASVATGT
jgi:hypothetical protein